MFDFIFETVSNLKKILESVFEYYSEVLNISLNEFIRPNAMKIAEKNNQCELGRLIQLVLGDFPHFCLEMHRIHSKVCLFLFFDNLFIH